MLWEDGAQISNAAGGGSCGSGIGFTPPGSGNVTSGNCTVTYNGQDAQHGLGAHQLYFAYTSNNTNSWTSGNSPVTQVSVTSATATISTPTAPSTRWFTTRPPPSA